MCRQCYKRDGMQEFRILGPLEVRSEEGADRPRRAAAARPARRLLLRAGRVVPTEQLVDELYGAEPPRTATASLQNAIVALRKALGPTFSSRGPRATCWRCQPEQIDARRFERLLADARRAASAEERRDAARAGARPLARPSARRVRLRGVGTDRDAPAR